MRIVMADAQIHVGVFEGVDLGDLPTNAQLVQLQLVVHNVGEYGVEF